MILFWVYVFGGGSQIFRNSRDDKLHGRREAISKILVGIGLKGELEIKGKATPRDVKHPSSMAHLWRSFHAPFTTLGCLIIIIDSGRHYKVLILCIIIVLFGHKITFSIKNKAFLWMNYCRNNDCRIRKLTLQTLSAFNYVPYHAITRYIRITWYTISLFTISMFSSVFVCWTMCFVAVTVVLCHTVRLTFKRVFWYFKIVAFIAPDCHYVRAWRYVI